jgi:hypothetical protein
MYPRNLQSPLRQLAQHYRVVTVTGPRQSGKTTLCRGTLPEALESLADQLTRGGERRRIERWLVYGGDALQRRSVGTAIPWSAIQDEDWAR